MSQVHVSTKYQIVIPKDIRRAYGIKPGQKLSFIARGDVIQVVPEKPFGSLKGIIKQQLDLSDLRDKSDKLW